MTVAVRCEAITQADFLTYARVRFRPNSSAAPERLKIALRIRFLPPNQQTSATGSRAGRRRRRAIAALRKPLYILASGVVGASPTATASVASER
jgi:hypothetical protein